MPIRKSLTKNISYQILIPTTLLSLRYAKRCLESDKQQYLNNCESNIINDPRTFWKFVRNTKKDGNIPNFMTLNDRTAVGGTGVCNLFAEFFQSNFTHNNTDFVPVVENGFRLPTTTLSSPVISYTDISCSLESLKFDGSKGPDGILSVFLRNCANNLLSPLFIIFNNCFRLGEFPSQWKLSNIIPVHKSASKSDINNYRPVSINNNFAKVFDHILASILTLHVKDVIIQEQHGFISGRSTGTNLFIFTNFVNE